MEAVAIQNEITAESIDVAMRQIENSIRKTPLQKMHGWSEQFGAEIYLKREDLQVVRSYKIRGALYKLLNLSEDLRKKGIVCASAGNHAQGVAYAANLLGIHAKIFMPEVTPQQKIDRVRNFGKEFIEIVLLGDSFDDANHLAIHTAQQENKTLIPPFDDNHIICGQGTVGLEILNQMKEPPDVIIIPIGGGGLASGVSTYIKSKFPNTKIYGVESAGAPAMKKSLKKGHCVVLNQINTFADGAAVRRVGDRNFAICQKHLEKVVVVDEGKLCHTIIQLYTEEAIVAEPAGVLSISALDQLRKEIKGKRVVCILSGGNNDITRMEEIKERALIYTGLKHYFIIRFPQRAGALKEFLHTLGPDDDISHFEYTKKNNREKGPALVGIELKHAEDYPALIERMEAQNIKFRAINDNPTLFDMLI